MYGKWEKNIENDREREREKVIKMRDIEKPRELYEEKRKKK